MPIVTITKKLKFNAAHRLHSEDLSAEENRKIFGKCNNPNGHGHNYTIEVRLRGEISSKHGMVANLTDVKRIVEETVCERLDHKFLNKDVDEFKHLVPTAENIAVVCWNWLQETEIGGLMEKIILHETDTNYCEYSGE